MYLNKGLIGSAVALSFACCAAQADPLQFDFTGTVNYTNGSLTGVTVGTIFTGSFSYDPTIPANYTLSGVSNYSLGSTSQITADIGGHIVVAGNLSADITNNAGGNVEDGVSIWGGYPLSIDGTVYLNGVFGFNLTTVPGNTSVLTNTNLPTSYDVAAFDGHSSLTYGVLQSNGGPRGGILGFTVNAIAAPVPEPETYAMMIAGLGMLSLLRARRRKAAY